jgi:hypothetical protein
LILLNILAISALFASNNFGRDLLNTITGSLSRIPEDIHQESGVTISDQLHTKYSCGTRGVGSTDREHDLGGYQQVTPTAELKQDGSARLASPSNSASIEMRAVNVYTI